MTGEQIEKLALPMMATNNQSPYQTAFTVSIEAREGVTTGISAADRARTVTVAIDSAKGPDDIVTPGHVFPLAARLNQWSKGLGAHISFDDTILTAEQLELLAEAPEADVLVDVAQRISDRLGRGMPRAAEAPHDVEQTFQRIICMTCWRASSCSRPSDLEAEQPMMALT